MAATNWNLYDELHYSDMYFEGEPLEESIQEAIEKAANELDRLDTEEEPFDIDNYGEFGHPY